MSSNTINGILLIDKPSGKTSFQVISLLRKHFSIKKAGHCGTLDKNATGLLVVGLGKSTKLLKHLFGLDKEYVADIYFGVATNTDDINGTVINKYEGTMDFDRILGYLPDFKGTIEQTPPDFSSIHVDGKRAYQLAVKEKDFKLKSRSVTIYEYEVLSFKDPVLKIRIHCSSGTYIRSIARDLGNLTGYYAHLSALRRTTVNAFSIDNAATLDDITEGSYTFLTPFEALPHIKALEIKKEFVGFIKNGRKLKLDYFIHDSKLDNGLYKVHSDKELLAIVNYDNNSFYYDLVY